jgi:hypothetical protein
MLAVVALLLHDRNELGSKGKTNHGDVEFFAHGEKACSQEAP